MNTRQHQLSGDHDQLPGEPGSGVLFEVALSLGTDRVRVRLSGEIDVTCTGRFRDLLNQLRRDGHRHVVLELSQLRFLSASAAGVLAHTALDYTHSGGSLLLSAPTRSVTRALELTGLHHLITADPDNPTPPPIGDPSVASRWPAPGCDGSRREGSPVSHTGATAIPTLDQATSPSRAGATTQIATRPVREVEAASDEVGYQYLQPLLIAYAAATQEPARARLREQLVTGYLPVARNVARRYAGRGEPLDDLEQVGCIGLLKAIERFDAELGRHFLSFAIPTITGEIRRHFRDKTWAIRVPRRLKDLQGAINTVVPELSAQLNRAPRPSEIAARLQTKTTYIVEALEAAHAYRPNSLDNPVHARTGDRSLADTYGQPDARFELFTTTHSLAPHLAALPVRERSIVIMRFYHDMTQTQIAEKIGVSQMHVSRLLAAILTKLRDAVDTDQPGLAREKGARRRPPGINIS